MLAIQICCTQKKPKYASFKKKKMKILCLSKEKNHVEVEDLWKNGFSTYEIMKEKEIQANFAITPQTAKVRATFA
jgi:hypothetical protein